MSVESAEMTKHAINAFLATSVTFINEIAALCEQSGADAKEVERGLKTETRIGPKAYLAPGAAFAGGTLARDVVFLKALGRATDRPTPPDGRRRVDQSRASPLGPPPAGVAAGIGEGPHGRGVGADLQARHRHAAPLDRGRAVPLAAASRAPPCASTIPRCPNCRRTLPPPIAAPPPEDAADGADALVVATEWPEYRKADLDGPGGAAWRPRWCSTPIASSPPRPAPIRGSP